MKYDILKELACFSRKELAQKVGNIRTADSLIYFYKKKDLLIPIKNNLYVVRDIESGEPLLNIYEIACCITPTSYISNHTAFEYYGMQNQVFNELYVSSKTQFCTIDYDFKWIKYLKAPDFSDGIIKIDKFLRITDIERTLVDSIKNINMIAGLEELFNNIQLIESLNYEKLKKYLSLYNSSFLIQKTGYIMELFKESLNIPQDFLLWCNERIGKNLRYFECSPNTTKKHYEKKWNLYVPNKLENYIANL